MAQPLEPNLNGYLACAEDLVFPSLRRGMAPRHVYIFLAGQVSPQGEGDLAGEGSLCPFVPSLPAGSLETSFPLQHLQGILQGGPDPISASDPGAPQVLLLDPVRHPAFTRGDSPAGQLLSGTASFNRGASVGAENTFLGPRQS